MTTSMQDIPIQPLFKIYKLKPGDITSRIFLSHAISQSATPANRQKYRAILLSMALMVAGSELILECI